MIWIKAGWIRRCDAGGTFQTGEKNMLFDIQKVSGQSCDAAIEKALLAVDATAQVTVEANAGLVRVEGLLSPQQAIEALAAAGFPASNSAPHSGEGSDCCGGCS